VGQVGGLGKLLTEWLARDQSRAEVRHEPTLGREQVLGSAPDTQTLRIWVVLINSRQARLYFADPAGQRFLLRDVPLRDGLDELGRERLAQVLATSAQAFVEQRVSTSAAEVARTFEGPLTTGGRLGDFGETPAVEPVAPSPERSVRAVPPRPLPTARYPTRPSRPGPAPRTTSWFWKAGVLYGMAMRGEEGVGHGPGVLVGLGRPWRGARWIATAKGQYQVPIKVTGDQTELGIAAYALRLSAAMDQPWGRHLAWGGEIGGGVDRAKFSSYPAPGISLPPEREDADWRPVALAALRGSVGGPSLRLALALGVTLQLAWTHYDVEGRADPDIEPWQVQPSLTVEASWQ
jgi:hypothetical protein